ncbi:MAG TPA: ATP-dependent DNA helicase RecG, partial [Flavobacteriales bacterium]|nr:ATP-dependent DNA helicase RecG [Flavobacteriales bacterium]
MALLPDTAIEYMKGVGPQRAESLKKELGIHTCWGLLNFFPYRYIDRSKFYTVSELHPDLPYVQLRGRITNIESIKGKGSRLKAIFRDETGSVELVWFQGAKSVESALKPGEDYVLFGKPNFFRDRYSIPHPELELLSHFNAGIKGNLQG